MGWTWRSTCRLWPALLCLLLGCGRPAGDSAGAPALGFKAARLESELAAVIGSSSNVSRIQTDGQRGLLLVFDRLSQPGNRVVGAGFRISSDGGKSFGPERENPPPPGPARIFDTHLFFSTYGLAAVQSTREGYRDFYVTRLLPNGSWTKPVQVNDEPRSLMYGGGGDLILLQTSDDDLYCLWTDFRLGFPASFFSASHDGGKSWTPNQAIEFDFRKGHQTRPRLLMLNGGRLLAAWEDNRDAETLVDIRCAYSDDGGRRWSPSRKINDDREHAWQLLGDLAFDGADLFAVFADYRNTGEQGFRDCDVYLARSKDRGQTWDRNIRISSKTEGIDDSPLLTCMPGGVLLCAWRSCGTNLFGDIVLAFSNDGGESWTSGPSIPSDGGLMAHVPEKMFVLGRDALLFWHDRRPGQVIARVLRIEPVSHPTAYEAVSRPREEPVPLNPEELPAHVLFRDDFFSFSTVLWEPFRGTWLIADGAYMGVEPGAASPYISLARFKEPDSYWLQGRFRLDPVHHHMACLYFRVDRSRPAYYVVANGFRTGACLSLQTENRSTEAFQGFQLDGTPLAQHPYPFQNDRWYSFALQVTPEGIRYFIDNQRLFSYSGRLELGPGRIGIGGYGSAPTYFDDMRILR